MKQLPFFLLLSLFFFQNCKTEKYSTFEGDAAAIEKAEAMFKAIGGKEGWANLKSLYIHAIHEEPGLDYPYESHIWRDLDDFKMRIEQRGPEFDIIGLFSEAAVEVQYLHRDTMRWFSPEDLEDEKFSHEHNVYVLLKKLATQSGISVKEGTDGRIEFYQNDELMVAFGLDDQNRPHRFFQLGQDGSINESLFTIWNTTEGLTHSAGGGPVDGNFKYETKVWQPSTQNLEEGFGVAYQAKSFDMSDLDWLVGKWERQRNKHSRYEEWQKDNDSTFSAISYALSEEDSVYLEGLTLRETAGDVFYIPTVPDQNDGQPIPFKMLGGFENRYIFLNPDHDFPQKFVYEKRGTDSLIVKVEGPDEGSWRTIEFGFRKVE